MQVTKEKKKNLLCTLLDFLNHDDIGLYIIVWREVSRSWFWRGCFFKFKEGGDVLK